MLLLRVAADIGERQDDHRQVRRGGFFGLWGRSELRLRRLANFKRIDPNRLGDVLELGWAEISDGEIEPPLDLPVGLLGEADRARRGDAFQSRGDVDAVAHQVAVGLFDDVAQMDADAELNAALGRQARIALDHAGLHFYRATRGVDHAAEFDDAAVAGSFDDAAVVDGDGRVDQVAAQSPQPRKGALFIHSR